MTPEEKVCSDIEKLLDDVVPKLISKFMNSRKVALKITELSKKYVEAKIKESKDK